VPSTLLEFTKKEIKDLLKDPKVLFSVIILPALIYSALGQSVSFAITKVAEETANISVVLLDEDGGFWSAQFTSYLRSTAAGKLLVLAGSDYSQPIGKALEEGADAIVFIPRGFSENITNGLQASINVTIIVRSLGISAISKMEAMGQLVRGFSTSVVAAYIAQAYPEKNPSTMLNPVVQTSQALIKGRLYPQSVAYTLANQGFLLVLGPLLVLSLVTSIAATSMGVEKEEKTLEVLLSLPLRRSHVVLGKTLATAVISVLGAASLSLGLFSYIAAIFSAAESGGGALLSLSTIVEVLEYSNLAKLGISLALCLLLGSVLGLIMASLASNVREAQALAGTAWMPVLIVFVLLSFVDFESFSRGAQLALSAVPFSAPVVVMKTAISASSMLDDISIVANACYLMLMLLLAVRWFDSERILAAKPSLRLRASRAEG